MRSLAGWAVHLKLSDPPALAKLEIHDVLDLNLRFVVVRLTAGKQCVALS